MTITVTVDDGGICAPMNVELFDMPPVPASVRTLAGIGGISKSSTFICARNQQASIEN